MEHVKEMYLSEANIINSKFLLILKCDGTLKLYWYNGETRVEETNPILTKKTNGTMKIEYGEVNLFGIRQTLQFTDEKGELEPNWEKIK